jgi:protein TonB
MSFAHPNRNPTRHSIGLGLVIMLHVALVWGLMNGLARHVVQLVKAPIEARILEEVKPPPPPPPKIEVAAPPKFTLPPAFLPPPEVQVQPPPQQMITATVAEPPAAPSPPVATRVEAPPAPVAAAPAQVAAAVVCSNYSQVMGDAGFPREATRLGLEEGNALVEFKDPKALRASHPAFARNSIRIVSEYRCAGQGRDVVVQVPFAYKLQ